MKDITLTWILDKDERPTKAGYYLTLSPYGTLQEIWYDPELGEWNCYDEKHLEENKKDGYRYNVVAWTNAKIIHKTFEENEDEQTEDYT